MNTFKKYCENVFVAECQEQYNSGEIIDVTTKYGKIAKCEVYNLVIAKGGLYYYSIVRTDIENYAKRKLDKYENLAKKRENKSDEWHSKAQEGREFLVLAEPIKVGHHSEGRHRALIARNDNRMRNCIAESQKAEEYKSKADYWREKENEINLSMPESLEFYTHKLEEAKKYHAGLKDGSVAKEHSYSTQYANKAVKDLGRKVAIATKLWEAL